MKKPCKPRSLEALGMILKYGGKGGPMRDRRARRAKDAKRSWRRDWE